MFVILVYDVGTKRVQKVMKRCRNYLHHVQRSVFEGNLTEAQLQRLKDELKGLIDVRMDAVSIYTVGSVRFSSKETIGISSDIEMIK